MPFMQTSTKKAFALSIVLWIVAALMFGIATLSMLSKDTITLTKGIDAKLKTALIAEDILESFKFYAMTANYDQTSLLNSALNDFKYTFPSQLILDNRWYTLSKDIKIRVIDTSGLINAKAFSGHDIATVSTNSKQRQLRYTISDSIQDWIDKDNIVSLNGAEDAVYTLQKERKYKTRDNPAIQSVGELRLINGLDSINEEVWKVLKDTFYYGNGTQVNLIFMDTNYLSYLLKISEIEADMLVQLRKKDLSKFISSIRKLKTFNDDYMGLYLSKQYKIEIEVTSSDTKSILRTIIDFRKKSHKPYTVISYKMI